MVVPSQIREKAGLVPGTPLEIHLEETGVRLTRAVPGPRIVRSGGRLVARPTAPAPRPQVDVPALVEEERDRWP